MASLSGSWRGSRTRPPDAATTPWRGSGRPNCAWLLATTMSQASASSVPPPRARPLTAAMIGFQQAKSSVIPPNGGRSAGRVAQVGARAEGLRASPGQDGDPQVVVGPEVIEGVPQFRAGPRVERVADLRPVDRHVRDPVGFGVDDVFVFHQRGRRGAVLAALARPVPLASSAAKIMLIIRYVIREYVNVRAGWGQGVRCCG
jgi:hypothetical protein